MRKRRASEAAAEVRSKRQQILDAAGVVFARKGYHKATVDEIIALADTGKGTVYNYFVNKEQLFYTLIQERSAPFEEIAEAFGKLLDEAWGVVRGKLLTAVSLSKEQQAGILARLEKQTSKQIALKFEVDPSILGGVVLQVGDNVLDASLRAQLAILRDIIKRGE